MYAKRQYNVILVDSLKWKKQEMKVIERLGALIEEFLERFSNHLEVCVVRVHGQNLISSSMRGRRQLK